MFQVIFMIRTNKIQNTNKRKWGGNKNMSLWKHRKAGRKSRNGREEWYNAPKKSLLKCITNSAYLSKMCVGVGASTCARTCACGCQNVFMDAMMPWVSSFTSCPHLFLWDRIFNWVWILSFGLDWLARKALESTCVQPWSPPWRLEVCVVPHLAFA